MVSITSFALVIATIEYASESRFTLFHADATFKLGDLGYPVITCGFSDAARKYQLGAIFIVSRRAGKEYAMCLGAFVRVIKRVRPAANLYINTVIGDAEDAQLNGFQQIDEFSTTTYLMCFFHVLYNGQKRTRHLEPDHRREVMDGIVRMHYTESMSAYYTENMWCFLSGGLYLSLNPSSPILLPSRYWRWQIFHTSTGFATTNILSETYNAVMKKYTGRRRYHMERLIIVTQVMAHDAGFAPPTTEAQI